MEIDLKDQIKNKFESLCAIGQSSEGDSIQKLRGKAFATFEQLGFPTIKNEDWKYTNVKPILKDNFSFTPIPTTSSYEEAIKDKGYFGQGLDAYTLILINGIYQPQWSNIPSDDSISIAAVEDVWDQVAIDEILNKDRNNKSNPFIALNTALFQGGIVIQIKKNKVLDKPIHLVHLGDSSEHYFQQSKNIFIAEFGSQAEIIESFENLNTESHLLRNAVTEIRVAANAKLQHYKLQKGDASLRLIEHTEVEQEGDSQYNNYTFTLPGYSFVRNNLNLALEGSNIDSHMYGLYLTNDHQLVDNHTLVDHQEPHCESNQMYKGIMMGHSRAIFNGKVYVHPIAQKTNAFQQNNNILFSDFATIYSKPQLEIFADDVKCSHGSTIGQLDPDALFYLKARGINEEDGRSMLVNAFAFDVTEKIENLEIKDLLNEAISQTMLGKALLV
ncbi:Fe-S cluster assembly protein SufD [Membranihabitans marinus]|uniref:Fe-S cluster assembly protein SufD n=1 Tax=Membranihabitans marinus TaxID=1227546 RepID=UPI001F00A187|nr:Fe-S cluster assembly protein SufD [Membranihabitans marinus]